MLISETLAPLINARVNRVLLVGQSSLPESQFVAFRKLVLDEFGERGLLADVKIQFASNKEWNGMGRK